MNGSDTVVLAISLQKGGVGKTTTAINLGAALAELGFRTLIIDLDPQGNASSGLGIHPPDDAPTIADVLRREETLDSIVEPTAEKNLFVAPAPTGQMLAEVEAQLVAEMFPQPRLKDAIDAVRDDWDYILMTALLPSAASPSTLSWQLTPSWLPCNANTLHLKAYAISAKW